MSVGYSSKPLSEKLGIKPETMLLLWHAPEEYQNELKPLPGNVTITSKAAQQVGFIHAFVTSQAEVEDMFATLKTLLTQDGQLWVSWKKGSKDLNENHIREYGLAAGLVDVKVIAVNEVWSGLKFVYRVKDRI